MTQQNWQQCTDEQLIAAMPHHQPQAVAELYDRYSPRLINYFYKWLQDREKATDFLHDLFIKVIDHAHSFQADKRFSTWLYAMATNMCKNEYRNQNNRLRILHTSYKHGVNTTEEINLEKFDNTYFKQRVQEVLSELNDELRTIFLLRFNEELSIKEIAEIIECPEGTVKSRLFYLMKKMAGQLEEFKPQ